MLNTIPFCHHFDYFLRSNDKMDTSIKQNIWLMKRKKMTCEIARNICIVQALAKLGHFPKRESEKEAWFLSPIRQETQVSFKVDKTLNRWYDHGIGKGGNSIDLVCLIKSCSVKEALKILENENFFFSFQQQPILESKKAGITINKIKNITHPALIKYLHSRKIPIEIARLYCKEIWYELKDKTYFAIGLKNQLGGWELRNAYFKNSISPKDITYIQNKNKLKNNKLIITEGMFDLLSILIYDPELLKENNTDFLVLNSTSFADKIIDLLNTYDKIELYLDNDKTGKRITQKFLENSKKCIDKSGLYRNNKDINAWLVSKKE
jgi:DNA primase